MPGVDEIEFDLTVMNDEERAALRITLRTEMVGAAGLTEPEDDGHGHGHGGHGHGEEGARLGCVLEAGVGEAEVLAHRDGENLCGPSGLLGAERGRAAGAGLASGQVQDRRRPIERRGAQQRAATRQLDVIAVRRDREDVYGRHGRAI